MTYIKRAIVNKIKNKFKNNRIIILVGSRQVGKTVIAKKIFEGCNVDQKLYLNLEDPRVLAHFENIDMLLKYLDLNRVDIGKPAFLVIDEFQYIKNATKLLKIIYDIYPNIKVLATGSSSVKIQKHLKESLAGRKMVYNIYQLSFEEFLSYEDKDGKYLNLTTENATPAVINTVNTKYLYKYLYYGSYPKITAEEFSDEEKKEELNEIFKSYLQRDITALVGGDNILAYNNLLKCIASQIGNLVNINELSNTLGISRLEVEKYILILQETFIIKLIYPYFKNKRKEISKMPKIFFYDQGIVNFILNNFSDIATRTEVGAIVENFVWNEIKNKISITDKIYFWRTHQGSEIDFILKTDDGIIPIEVKWKSVVSKSIPKSFRFFFANNPNAIAGIIVTKDFTSTSKLGRKKIFYVPAVLMSRFMYDFTNLKIS